MRDESQVNTNLKKAPLYQACSPRKKQDLLQKSATKRVIEVKLAGTAKREKQMPEPEDVLPKVDMERIQNEKKLLKMNSSGYKTTAIPK